MPDWFRARAQWLHTLAYVSVKTIHLIPGGMSALFVKVMQCFWGPELNLQTLGVRLMRGTADASFVAKIKFGCFLSDEKAEKEIIGVKGASGTRMCLECVNCVRISAEAVEGTTMVNFANPDMTKFERHSVETFNATLDHIMSAAATMNKSQFKIEQQCAGITYNPDGLMYSDFRDMAQVPLSRYPDWFHNLAASGGVAQYQVNKLALDLKGEGVQLSDIDNFEITMPKSYTKL